MKFTTAVFLLTSLRRFLSMKLEELVLKYIGHNFFLLFHFSFWCKTPDTLTILASICKAKRPSSVGRASAGALENFYFIVLRREERQRKNKISQVFASLSPPDGQLQILIFRRDILFMEYFITASLWQLISVYLIT